MISLVHCLYRFQDIQFVPEVSEQFYYLKVTKKQNELFLSYDFPWSIRIQFIYLLNNREVLLLENPEVLMNKLEDNP